MGLQNAVNNAKAPNARNENIGLSVKPLGRGCYSAASEPLTRIC